MKTLIQKKWFRRFCQTAVAVVSLLALSLAAFNWNGSRVRREAVARMERHGWPSDFSDVLGNMPPDDSNYAMLPILRDIRMEMDEARRTGKWQPVPPHSARARWAALYEKDFAKTRPRAGQNREFREFPDFSLLPKGNPYGTTAESFLREYDRRNGLTLQELIEGLSLPETRQPLGAQSGTDWFQLSEAFGMSMRSVADGLCLRAYAAMVTGDSAKAMESIVLGLRLSEVTGSRKVPVSLAIQRVMILSAAQRVKQGMKRRVWTEADLVSLRAAFDGIRMRERLEGSLALSARAWVETWERWEGDRKDFEGLSYVLEIDRRKKWMRFIGPVLPAGWFDLNAAGHANRWLDLEERIDSSSKMGVWYAEARKLKEAGQTRSRLPKLFFPTQDGLEPASLVEWVSHAEVVCQESMLGCDLELHRLKHGTYPVSLAELSGSVPKDPLHESDFIYRRDGDFFVLYSTGPDGKDDGGVRINGKGPPDQPDWTW